MSDDRPVESTLGYRPLEKGGKAGHRTPMCKRCHKQVHATFGNTDLARVYDKQGEVRLITPSMTWEDYVHLAFDEIRMVGAGSPQVSRRLRAALQDLLTIAPPERQVVLQEQLDLLQSGIDSTIAEGSDRTYSKRGDPSGLG